MDETGLPGLATPVKGLDAVDEVCFWLNLWKTSVQNDVPTAQELNLI